MTVGLHTGINKNVSIYGNIVSTANGDYGNAETYYTYMNLANEGYVRMSLRYVIQNTTVTVEGSNDDREVADASKTWADISTTILGAANVTATGTRPSLSNVPWAKIRFKAVTTNATNALDIYVCATRG